MKKTIFLVMAASFFAPIAMAQVQKTVPIKNKTVPAKLVPASVPSESVYTITAAKVTVKTGNDNKEQLSKVMVTVDENDGIWGKGRQLFHPQNNEFKSEIKITSLFEFPLTKSETNSGRCIHPHQSPGQGFEVHHLLHAQFYTGCMEN